MTLEEAEARIAEREEEVRVRDRLIEEVHALVRRLNDEMRQQVETIQQRATRKTVTIVANRQRVMDMGGAPGRSAGRAVSEAAGSQAIPATASSVSPHPMSS